MNKLFIAIIILAAVGGAGWWYYGQEQNTAPMPEAVREIPSAPAASAPEQTTITYTDTGFSPAAVTVKKGNTVMFKNESSRDSWPASAMHPTHMMYPGTDIKQCGTGAAADMFDACRGLKPGESWNFMFNESGKWGYHDHMNAKHFGSITVTE